MWKFEAEVLLLPIVFARCNHNGSLIQINIVYPVCILNEPYFQINWSCVPVFVVFEGTLSQPTGPFNPSFYNIWKWKFYSHDRKQTLYIQFWNFDISKHTVCYARSKTSGKRDAFYFNNPTMLSILTILQLHMNMVYSTPGFAYVPTYFYIFQKEIIEFHFQWFHNIHKIEKCVHIVLSSQYWIMCYCSNILRQIYLH